MRNALQIIRSAIGDFDYKHPERTQKIEQGDFECYKVTLPSSFKGITPTWYFAIYTEREKRPEKMEIADVKAQAQVIGGKAIKGDFLPLVIASDDPSVRFTDEQGFVKKLVFYLDQEDLPGKDTLNDRHLTPIILAVKNKLSPKKINLISDFNPYRPNTPALGWRFFGRKRELEKLVYNEENYMVVGARRIGKTSLLREAGARLRENGEQVYYVPVQHCSNSSEVIQEIAKMLSSRHVANAVRRSKMLDENYLHSIIKQLVSDTKKRAILILDELGNVITKSQKDDWRIIGILREYSHTGHIRVIASGFQEILIKQLRDFEGPFVNFAAVLRLGVFSNPEVKEFLIELLEYWGNVPDEKELEKLITKEFGNHPLILQHLGSYLFKKSFNINHVDVESDIRNLLEGDDFEEEFENPVNDIFFMNQSNVQRYVFLRCCYDATEKGRSVYDLVINEEKIISIFKSINVSLNFDSQMYILQGLELRGLTYPVRNNKLKHRIATPVVYRYIERFYDPEELIEALEKDIIADPSELALTHV